MKKWTALVLALALATLCCTAALATEAQYKNTKAFLKLLDDKGVIYTVTGVNESSGYEQVTVKNKGQDFSYTINYFFHSDDSEVGIRVWDIINYSSSDEAALLREANTLNRKYKHVRWVVDDTNNTISATMDVLTRNNADTADILWEYTIKLVNLLDTGYPVFQPYAK